MRKRSLILLLFPIILILWTIGWTFLWVGGQQTSQNQKTQDNIHITVHLPEQKQKIPQ